MDDGDALRARAPNIFELIASDKLKDSLREAFRYLLNSIRQHESFSTSKLSVMPTDETVLLLDLLIEYNYLKAYNASYSEQLYNLIRRNNRATASVFGGNESTTLSTSNLIKSLVCLTIVPYVQRKIDRHFESINYKETRTADELKRLRLYRLFTRSASFINLLCIVRFAAGQSSYHNIVNCITGISLDCKTMTLQDLSPNSVGVGMNEGGAGTGIVDSQHFSKIVADLLGRALTIGSYIIQFLDFWNTHSNSTPLFSAALPIPEPPCNKQFIQDSVDNLDVDHDNTLLDDNQYIIGGDGNGGSNKPKVMSSDETIKTAFKDVPYTDEKSSSICLICEHVRQNECALSNTGYVFCYGCIYKYVKSKARCPITRNPATVDNIVKLYQEDCDF